ncbi:hypothetical protein OEA41_004362 [Lepraria neglecta]|uniref:DUF7730 domain-containing protein n=1 Tax=Lepraria neglecta TaxID=209136 RepID=A0AAD9YYZ3_9LECA|nr:hypothetical protein OEA41_004362 [Lepraria neglecta]
MATSKPSFGQDIIRLPTPQVNASTQTIGHAKNRFSRHVLRNQQSKQVIPGLPESPKWPILDRRSLDSPGRPLVRLPIEPTTPRALRYERQGVFPFLDLPAELRNQIYDLAIPKEHYAIEWVNNNHKTKSQTYRLPRSDMPKKPLFGADLARRRRALDTVKGRKTEPLPKDYYGPVPTTLLLVCKQMHDEAASIFYSKSTFRFHGLGALRFFLNHLTPCAYKSISKLALQYQAYGHPCSTKDQIWKAKHDRLWDNLCERLTNGTKEDPTNKCSLTHLSLDLTLNKSPISFTSFEGSMKGSLSTRWMWPLWAFQDAGIQRCWARIRCSTKDSTVLEVESWKLRKEILRDLWNEEQEARRDAYGFEHHKKNGKPVKNTRTMVMRLNVNGTLIPTQGPA